MDYALDTRTGEKVFPSGAMRHRRYLCPCCKKEVTVRSVDRFSQRIAHFAHLKGRADKNCENFFESISSQVPTIRKFQQLVPKNLELNFGPKIYDGLTKSLYLVLREDQVQLYFQFRVKSGVANWTGQITIEALDGVRFFSSSTINGKHEIPVSIGFSDDSIKSFGIVDEDIWRLLSSDIPKISQGMDFFHAPYSNGRMLGSLEPLVLGEVYIASSKSSLNKYPSISPMIEATWNTGGIDFFQIRLPNYLPVDDRVMVEEIFSRKISQRRPAFKLLDPLPHFIELDGTVRIANSSSLIVLGFDCDPNEIKYVILGGVSGLDMVEFNQNFMLVDLANSRGIEIYFQQCLMIRIEKGRIPEMIISGVIVNVSGIAHRILDSNSMRSIPLDTEFNVECSLTDITKKISVSRGYKILGSPTNGQRFLSGSGVRVDADSFGCFEFLDEDFDNPITHEKTIPPAECDPVEKWIKTLSLLDGGINSYLNSGLNTGIGSKALNIGRNHLRGINLRKNSTGAKK